MPDVVSSRPIPCRETGNPRTDTSTRSMKFKRILSELKRRNVPKAALAYLVVAWMVVQVGDTIFPAYDIPDWVFRWLVTALIVGFPIWVVFSWIYDLTPEGIEKTPQQVETATGASDPHIGQRLNKIIIVSLSLAVVLLLYNQFGSRSASATATVADSSLLSGALAVLPLTNTRPDPESDYLGFAISNQIIGDLMYLQNLNIRSSAEVRKYISKAIDLDSLGKELRVDFVLLGNYLKEQNQIRVNVELLNLKTRELLWRSDDIEVEFSNTFSLQDIVAKKVIDDLNIKFNPREMEFLSRDVPQSPLAFEYYLKSTSYPLNSEGDRLSVAMLRKSIEIDSSYAPAYAELGFRSQRLLLFEMMDPESREQVEKYYLKALELNPDQLMALGYLVVFYTETARTEQAIELARHMLEINPNNASALFSLGYLYRYIGMTGESVRFMERAVALDPENPNFARIGVTYLCQGRYEDALQAFRRGKDTSYSLIWQAISLFRMGRYQEALSYFDQLIREESEPYMRLNSIAYKSIINGETQVGIDALLQLEQANTPDSEGWYYLAVMYSGLGETEGALRCLRESVERGYYNYPFIQSDPLLEPVRDKPEFQEVLEEARSRHLYFRDKFFREASVASM